MIREVRDAEQLSSIGETEWELVLRAHNGMLAVGKQSMRYQRGPAYYVPTLLEGEHNRAMKSDGTPSNAGREAFGMHYVNGIANVAALRCVGNPLQGPVFLSHIPFFPCGGQWEGLIGPGFVDLYEGAEHADGVMPGTAHSHCGIECDLIPQWFTGQHPERDYETEVAKDFADCRFVSHFRLLIMIMFRGVLMPWFFGRTTSITSVS